MILSLSEYVKTLDHIYHYNNRRKMEFIKKGMGNAGAIVILSIIFNKLFSIFFRSLSLKDKTGFELNG